MLTFVYKNFDGCAPTPGGFDSRSQTLLDKAKDTLNTVDGLLYCCHFKQAIKSAMSLAQEANRYLEEKSPWKVIKKDRQAAANSLYVALTVISNLRTMLYPFLPFSSQKVHEYLGFEGNIGSCGWKWQDLPPGQKLLPPEPLFSKLDEAVVEEETSRLGATL